MDFMKVLDQTVREIKREVNLKVLKVPEIEQKVLDATSDEPWGPHGSDLLEIAQATKKFTEWQMVMNVLWTRISDTSANWRHIYKALSVIEYLIAHGSERAVDDIVEHSHQISCLSGFESVDPNGKDVGINVRKKVETILDLLEDKEKLQAVRDKAAANRDKYFGLSSTGITYKSSSSSYSGTSYHQSDHYGNISGSREGESFRDGYRENEKGHQSNADSSKSQERFSNEKEGTKVKKGVSRSARNHTVSINPLPKLAAVQSTTPNAQADKNEDDFDPRGLSAAGSSNKSSMPVDLLGGSLVGDLLDAPISQPSEVKTSNTASVSEDDLFADAAFVSAAPHSETNTHTQPNLFADKQAFPASSPAYEDLFQSANLDFPSEAKLPNSNSTNINSFDPFAVSNSFLPSKENAPAPTDISTNSSSFDPFAAIPMDNVDGSDEFFGAFASNTKSESKNSSDNNNSNRHLVTASQPAPKDPFQVKSGIWADSLSRGLIDLNITARKKTNLADIGIVGGFDDEPEDKERAAPASASRGKAMGAGSRLGVGFISSSTTGRSGNFTSYEQSQYVSFQ